MMTTTSPAFSRSEVVSVQQVDGNAFEVVAIGSETQIDGLSVWVPPSSLYIPNGFAAGIGICSVVLGL